MSVLGFMDFFRYTAMVLFQASAGLSKKKKKKKTHTRRSWIEELKALINIVGKEATAEYFMEIKIQEYKSQQMVKYTYVQLAPYIQSLLSYLLTPHTSNS